MSSPLRFGLIRFCLFCRTELCRIERSEISLFAYFLSYFEIFRFRLGMTKAKYDKALLKCDKIPLPNATKHIFI